MARDARVHDVQVLHDAETHAYEAVASLAVDGRVARVADVAGMTGRPESEIRRSLLILVEHGWLLPKGGGFVLGPHDWGLDY